MGRRHPANPLFLILVLPTLVFVFTCSIYLRRQQSWLPIHGQFPEHRIACKVVPGSPQWPSLADWARFEKSLSQPLLRPVPPAAVCHRDHPSFSRSRCESLRASWADSSFHASDPISVDFPNWDGESCLPVGVGSCTASGFPYYVVNATAAEDIVEAVNFAQKHNIRLVVKGSGHCYLGRSTAPNSLSLWTHYLQGLNWTSDFQPVGCPSAPIAEPAVTIMAGMKMEEIYTEGDKRNLTIVGGLAPTVGIGGYILGGGHGPLSAFYGLAADQVLEMQVVSAAGEILFINECQHSELFWAMRGGGGNAFGVLVSVTVKTFPTPRIISNGINLAFEPKSEKFWTTCARMHSLLPQLGDAGIMGYYSCRRPNLIDKSAQVGWVMLSPERDKSSYLGILDPILSQLETEANQTINSNYQEFLSFASFFSELQDTSPAGTNRLVGSRLLDRQALTKSRPALEHALRSATPPGGLIAGCLVSGPGVWQAKPRGGGNAVHNAWRTAYSLELIPLTWDHQNKSQQLRSSQALTSQYVKALRELAPQTGTYLNEADPQEPDYEESLWGLDHWSRLSQIKEIWDPQGVFYCRRCIGSEKWVEVDGVLCKRA